MPDTDLPDLSLSEAAALIESRQLSPLELTRACIERAERLGDPYNAYLTRTFDTALQEASIATEDIAVGDYRGPLHGIPFALKDLFETAGLRTTAASPLRETYVPDVDAFVVQRLRRAGAVFLGKLNLHEWALGTTNINAAFATTRNPWDVERITGGSSGGSAAAIAAGFCLGTLGSDTGGSIRIPASLCGITGLKPTYGRVSLRGVVPLAWSLDHAGPMARSAADCARILQAIAGFDPADPTCADEPVPDYVASLEGGIDGLRIGLPRAHFFDPDSVEPDVLIAIEEALRQFGSLGARLRDVEVPLLDAALVAQRTMLLADAAAYHADDLRQRSEAFGPNVLRRLQDGAGYSAIEYAQARRVQAEFKSALRDLFQGVDLLALPTTATAAMPIEDADTPAVTVRLGRNTGVFNLAGLPAISLPCGFTLEGMPVGLCLVGRPWEEATVLRAAHAYQQATDWHQRHPPLPS